MEQNTQNKLEIKDRLVNFYNLNKIKIIIFFSILLLTLISITYVNYNNARKNTLIGEKYIQAGLYLASDKKENAKALYEEIILSKNKFYSILALNSIVEKKLIEDNNKILEYFNFLEKSNSNKEIKDLIIFKKALYLIKFSDESFGQEIFKDLVEKNSTLKKIILELIEK
tara:strand:+ start:130 stop:639 length:510 start_codon:yes stop_codon:yes gene_type:complete